MPVGSTGSVGSTTARPRGPGRPVPRQPAPGQERARRTGRPRLADRCRLVRRGRLGSRRFDLGCRVGLGGRLLGHGVDRRRRRRHRVGARDDLGQVRDPVAVAVGQGVVDHTGRSPVDGSICSACSTALVRPSPSGSSSPSGVPSASLSVRCGLPPERNSVRLVRPSPSSSSDASSGSAGSSPFEVSQPSGSPSPSASAVRTVAGAGRWAGIDPAPPESSATELRSRTASSPALRAACDRSGNVAGRRPSRAAAVRPPEPQVAGAQSTRAPTDGQASNPRTGPLRVATPLPMRARATRTPASAVQRLRVCWSIHPCASASVPRTFSGVSHSSPRTQTVRSPGTQRAETQIRSRP